jgi:hypothetical protein
MNFGPAGPAPPGDVGGIPDGNTGSGLKLPAAVDIGTINLSFTFVESGLTFQGCDEPPQLQGVVQVGGVFPSFTVTPVSGTVELPAGDFIVCTFQAPVSGDYSVGFDGTLVDAQGNPAVFSGAGTFVIRCNNDFQCDPGERCDFGFCVPAPDTVKAGFEFPVSSFADAANFFPDVAEGGDGILFAVWSRARSGITSIVGRRFSSSDASPLGTEFQINTYTVRYPFSVSVVENQGQFLVVWDTLFRPASVFGRRLDAAGHFIGSEFQLSSFTAGLSLFPIAAPAVDGGFMVVWQHNRYPMPSGRDIIGQRFDSDGGKVGSEFVVNAYTTGEQRVPHIVSDPVGNFIVAWGSDAQDDNGQQGSLSGGVFAQRFDSAANPVGTEFQVNTYTPGPQGAPVLARLGDESFVVAWQSREDGSAYGYDVFGYGVFAQRIDSDGQPLGSEFQVNTFTRTDQVSPEVQALRDGGFVIAWSSSKQDDGGGGPFDANGGVFAQRFAGSGERVGTEFRINTYVPNLQQGPAMAATPGGFVVVWQSEEQYGVSNGLFGQRFDLVP